MACQTADGTELTGQASRTVSAIKQIWQLHWLPIH